MKMKRIISTVLAVLMLISAFAVTASATETSEDGGSYAWKTKSSQPTLNYFTGMKLKPAEAGSEELVPDVDSGVVIKTPEDKLEYMDLRFEKDGYQIYVDHYSGEVATRCVATGEILFSNPYTVGNSVASDSIKTQLMSQIIVKYTDVTTGDSGTYYSYEWAAQRSQIIVRNIKNGVRVEYTIGREESRMLVPRLIEKSSFENNIKNIMEAAVAGDGDASFLYNKFKFYYQEYGPDSVHPEYDITKKMSVYALDSKVSDSELALLEQLIKTYCPDYTYEKLDEDHMLTEYEGEDKNPPLFKMALEYTLDNMGVTVRLPANGIRFNESLYQLDNIEILPYMGAGAKSNADNNFSQYNSGYTLFPDGSGAIFDFEKITDLGASLTVSGKVYGQDYAYHTLSTTPHQEVIRYPVFGVTSTQDMTALESLEVTASGTGSNVKYSVSAECDVPEEDRAYKSSGFMAIIEEGDALVELSTYHAVRPSEYNTVRMKVYPRPKDEYNVADAISVGGNDTWTVVSSRKYTGDYSVRYIMLTDDEVAKSKGITDYYDCNYVGMARAYRDYLENKEILTRLTDEDVGEDIPLYIESFGAIYTTQRILSMPVTVMTPLTTFEDIKTMRDALAEKGVENINFILNGFTDGGLTGKKAPYHVDWEDSVSKEMEFEELLEYARDNDFGIYPDFDFAYVSGDYMFDGVSLSNHAVKTIDNRYTSKREYSATKQTYVSYYELAISPAYFVHFYDKFTEEYSEYNPMGVSVSTLGSALNSDFDEDEPYNRDDSKGYTVDAFEHMAENYEKVMTSGGNAYSWGYVDYITDVALDSSRFSQAYASVPFLGMVLHGYVEIAGTPINMEGNIDYAVLKAIENGASLKFILSYRNTSNLKKFEDLSKYYSVRYDIWFDDVVSLYNEVNDVLAGVQTSLIEEHKFIEGVRVPDADELLADAASTVEKALQLESAYLDANTQAEKDAYRNAKAEIESFKSKLTSFKVAQANYETYKKAILDVKDSIKNALDKYMAAGTPATEQVAAYNQIRDDLTMALNRYNDLFAAADLYDDSIKNTYNGYFLVENEYKTLINSSNFTDAEKNDIISNISNTIAVELLNPTVIEEYNTEIDKCQEIPAAVKKAYKDLTNIQAVIDAINADAALSTEQKADFVNKLNAISTAIAVSNAKFANAGSVDEMVANEQTRINTELGNIRAMLVEMINNVQAGADETDSKKPFSAGSFVAPEELICTFAPEEDNDDADREQVKPPVYSSDDCKIVYEKYDNGTAFLLNFNNYQVMVAVNGTIYTLEAYGYIVLSNND